MESTVATLALVSSIIAVLFIFAYFNYRNQSKIKITRLNEIIESYHKELLKARTKLSPAPNSIQYNFRPSREYSLQVQCDVLGKENQALKKQLDTALKDLAAIPSKPASVPASHAVSSSKVETADRDFLLQELGNKSKRISQLQSDVASLHHQIEQLRNLYPHIDEILALQSAPAPEAAAHNHSRDYLSQDEWDSLSDTQRNQLALDRYIQSHSKTKWQIGRDYELFVAHKYRQQGYDVDPCGSYLKLEDMGRDLILKKDGLIRIVQCKYWSNSKIINERFIFLLYGSVISYCIEHSCPQSIVKGIFVTNTSLSDMAKKCADALGILVMEQYQMGDFPRIKCNVKKDSYSDYTYIYHLPMDPQYDRVKIAGDRECYAYTVEEAESYGFRRAQ